MESKINKKYRCWIDVEAGSVEEAIGKAETNLRVMGFTKKIPDTEMRGKTRYCLDCDKETPDTPCPYCGGTVGKYKDSQEKKLGEPVMDMVNNYYEESKTGRSIEKVFINNIKSIYNNPKPIKIMDKTNPPVSEDLKDKDLDFKSLKTIVWLRLDNLDRDHGVNVGIIKRDVKLLLATRAVEVRGKIAEEVGKLENDPYSIVCACETKARHGMCLRHFNGFNIALDQALKIIRGEDRK